MTYVAILIPTELFFRLQHCFEESGAAFDPTEALSGAVEYFLDNASWKPELVPQPEPFDRGFLWKELFLPHGTQLRMKYQSRYFYAAVEDDEIIYEGEPVSPSGFTISVTGTSRNAWADIEVKRPNDTTWVRAKSLREGWNAASERANQNSNGTSSSSDTILSPDDSWLWIVALAIWRLGRCAHLSKIYSEVGKICAERSISTPKRLEETVRGTIYDNCSTSKRYKGVHDVFEKRGRGLWALRDNVFVEEV